MGYGVAPAAARLGDLAFPLCQVLFGAAELARAPRHAPFRLHCVRALHGVAAAANSHATPAAAKRPEAEAEETPLTLGKLQLELPSASSIAAKAGPPPASKPGLKPAFKLALPPKLDLGQLAPAGPAAQPGSPGGGPPPDGDPERQRAEESGAGEPRFTGDLEEDVEMLLRMEEAAGHGGGDGNGEATFGGEAEEDFDHGAASDESDLVITEEPEERERRRARRPRRGARPRGRMRRSARPSRRRGRCCRRSSTRTA